MSAAIVDQRELLSPAFEKVAIDEMSGSIVPVGRYSSCADRARIRSSRMR
jgi:hypothetical protein